MENIFKRIGFYNKACSFCGLQDESREESETFLKGVLAEKVSSNSKSCRSSKLKNITMNWKLWTYWLRNQATFPTATPWNRFVWIHTIIFQSITFWAQTCKRPSTHAHHHHHHPLLSCYPVKAICLHRCDYSVYCASANRKQRIRSRKQEAGSNRPSDTLLICQPCETRGAGFGNVI